jgi:O-antigen ligase
MVMTLVRGFSLDAVVPTLTGPARYTFNETHSVLGLCLASTLVLVATLFPSALNRRTVPEKAVAVAALGLTGFIFIVALIMVKSRSGWLALVVGLMASGAAFIWANRKTMLHKKNYIAASIGAAIVASVLVIATAGDVIAERFEPAVETIGQIDEAANRDETPEFESRSLAVRVAYLVFAGKMFINRPFFGYGPADPRYLRNEHPAPALIAERTDNLHSSYSQLLLSFGVIGGLPFIMVFALAGYWAWKFISDEGKRALGAYGLGFIAAFALWGIGNLRLHDFDLLQLYATSLGAILAGPSAVRIANNFSDGKSSGPF